MRKLEGELEVASRGSSEELDRLKLIFRAISNLEQANLISLENCELSLPEEFDQKSLVSSLPQGISDKIKFQVEKW
jgi:hypothetical protein